MIDEKIKANYPLAPLTTYRIGGPAEYFLDAESEADLLTALEWARAKSLPVTFLGGGSNILIHDEGVKGLVIRVGNSRLDVEENIFRVGAHRSVKEVSELAYDKSLSGIEWAIGIPGAMGGAIRGNAGAHGGSFDRVVMSVRVLDTNNGQWKDLNNEECGFRYRHSRIKDEPWLVIWEIVLELQPGNKDMMEKEMEGFRQYRRNSQPWEPSAGCVFKNFLAAELKEMNPALVQRAEEEGKIRGGKVGAGYLVEKLGMMGYRVGDAMISDKHANFVINVDQAKAVDVAAVMAEVRRRAREAYGVEMEDEVQYLGF